MITSIRIDDNKKTPFKYIQKIKAFKAIGAHDTARTGEGRVLSPAWYRAAVEFQGRPEQERLAFCSWCCCHGGCNLCMDISKYNIKGLKIYGG